MTTRISPNFRQQILCPQQVSVNTTLTGMDAYKVWTHTVVGSRTFTLPAAKKGAGPMYFCEQQATNVIVVQPQATDNIVGNGAGVPITMNTTGAFLGLFCELDGTWSVISASPGLAGAGTVSSVGLADGSGTPIYNISGSPVTTSGTLTFTFKTQTANTVLAGPTSGGAAQPAFRALVAADVPSSILPGGFTGFANPSGLIGMTAVNGVATTADRSDSTHAIDPAIAPVWTGLHQFQRNVATGATATFGVTQAVRFFDDANVPSALASGISIVNGAASPTSGRLIFGDGSGWQMAFSRRIGSVTTDLMVITDAGNVTLATPTAGTTLLIGGLGSVTNVRINTGSGAVGLQLAGTSPLQRIQDTGASGSILELQAFNGTAVINTNWVTTATPLSIRINSTEYLRIATTGAITIPGPASGNVALTITAIGSNGLQINGAAGQYTTRITAASGAGTSFGLDILAGTNSTDQALRILSQNTTTQFMLINGDGSGALGPTSTLGISWAVAGNVTIAAPTSGTALTVNQVTGSTEGLLVKSTDLNALVSLTTTSASGAYIRFINTATVYGYLGSANRVTSGAANDFAITSVGANALNLGTNTTNRLTISSAGNVTINAPTSGVALTVNGFAGAVPLAVTGDTTGNWSATFTSTSATESRAAIAFINNRTTSQTWAIGQNPDGGTDKSFSIRDVTRNALTVTVGIGGNVTIAVPTSGTTVLATGVASGVVYQAAPSATGAGVAFYDNVALTVGLVITSSGSDFCKFQNDGANLWSIATNNALATLGTPVFQWANNGTPKLTGRGPVAAALVDMTPDKGSFTITYTGMTTVITGTAVWVRKGEQVQLHFPAATGTSNATSFTATGLPTDIQPTRTQILSVPPGGAQNSGSLVASGAGVIVTAASGTATFQLTGSSTGWTASGTKGVLGAFSVAYMLN